MSNFFKLKVGLGLALFLFMTADMAEARHLKLYTYDIPEIGDTAVTYSFDYVEKPKAGYAKGNPTLHEIEVEHTIMDHWLQSFYVDYDYAASVDGQDAIAEVSSIKTEFNITFFEKDENFADFRLNIEFAKMMNNKISAYGETDAADTVEFRFIFEKNFPGFSIVLSPIVLKEIGGPQELAGLQYGYANAILFDYSDKVGLGLEFHGSLGESDDFNNSAAQSHTIVANTDIALSKRFTVSVGAGFGLTDSSDDFTLRTAVQYVFGGGN